MGNSGQKSKLLKSVLILAFIFISYLYQNPKIQLFSSYQQADGHHKKSHHAKSNLSKSAEDAASTESAKITSRTNSTSRRKPASIEVSNSTPILQEDEINANSINFPKLGTFNESSFTKKDLSELDPTGFYDNAANSIVIPFLKMAKKSIDIEIYEMSDPIVLKTIKERVDQNIQLRIIKDSSPLGEKCQLFSDEEYKNSNRKIKQKKRSITESESKSCFIQKEFKKYIESKKQKMVPFQKSALCGQSEGGKNCYEHGKIILIDNKYALISSGNLNNSNLCDTISDQSASKCNRDYSYVTQDPDVLASLQTIFNSDFKGERNSSIEILALTNTSNNMNNIQKMTVSPFSEKPILDFLYSAKESVRIQNQYLKYKPFLKALIELAKLPKESNPNEHIQIFINLADECAFGEEKSTNQNLKFDDIMKDRYYRNGHLNNSISDAELPIVFAEMEKLGIHIRMFSKNQKIQGKAGYLHAKAIVVDDQKAWIGSMNGSDMSVNFNREYGIFFSHPQRVANLVSVMQADFNHPESLSWKASFSCESDSN